MAVPAGLQRASSDGSFVLLGRGLRRSCAHLMLMPDLCRNRSAEPLEEEILRSAPWKWTVPGMAAIALVLVLAACGSSSSSSSSQAANTSSSAAGSAQSAGVARARAALKGYIGTPSPFPVSEPLKKVPKAKTIIFANCGSTACGLLWTLMEPAAAAMGLHAEQVNVGTAASTVGPGFNAIIAKHPNQGTNNGGGIVNITGGTSPYTCTLPQERCPRA